MTNRRGGTSNAPVTLHIAVRGVSLTTIHRATFRKQLKNGISLKDVHLNAELKKAGVSKADLQKLDTNKDGVIKGRELNAAFEFVDGFDKNGSGHSYLNSGAAGALYGAFRGAGKSSPSIDVDAMKKRRTNEKRGNLRKSLRETIDRYNESAKGLIQSMNR